MRSYIQLALFILITVQAPVFAQSYEPSEQRSSFSERKKSIMDGNDMRASYHNFGQGGRVNGNLRDEFPYEYPKNSRREYMLFIMAVLGGDVYNQAETATPGSRFPVVTFGNLKSAPNGDSWSLNPVGGYTNPNSRELARSDRGPGNALGNSWPPVWPDKLTGGGDGWAGSWNGYFGRDQFNADLEFYYRMGDDTYTRYLNGTTNKYQPDATDATRGGIGIVMDSRILAWTQTLISNIHFNIYEMTNDGSFPQDKIAFGLWMADLVATTSTDDIPLFDAIRSIAYITDGTRTPYPPFFEGPIGEMGIKFLETPGNALDGIDNDGDSYSYDSRQGDFFPTNGTNDDLIQHHLASRGGFYSSEAAIDSVIQPFSAPLFNARNFQVGDKLIAIDENYNRIVVEYEAGLPFKTRGRPEILLPAGGLQGLVEDFLPDTDPNFGVHVDLTDNDFDGLIDENKPNHLEKNTFTRTGVAVQQAVRFINYFHFQVGDTIKPGYIVSNRQIRERLASDAAYRSRIQTDFNGEPKNITTSAPMIDEGRDDRMDNDNDWVASSDDVGIIGDKDTPSTGLGDGYPTSGAGTPFPGESSIDKTDVSETDLIGVSRVSIIRAGVLRTDQDAQNWRSYLSPGTFQLTGVLGEDADIFVTSSLFPLLQGQTERFAVAISSVQTKSTQREDDRAATNDALVQATNAYEADYQFATAPIPPVLTAVTADRKVVLYWDTSSEFSFDRYIQKVGGDGYDFEGYRIYRSTDVGLDGAKTITDGNGVPLFLKPLAIYDKINGFSGYHPTPVRGTQFFMGSNTGLKYFFVDSTVVNGKEYFYAVTGFDYGLAAAGIAPSESPIASSREADGTVTLGRNIVRVRPAASVAGTISAENPGATHTVGAASGVVNVAVIDHNRIRDGKTYRVTFADTLVAGGANAPDTLKTKHYFLVDVTSASMDTLIRESTKLAGEDNPVIDGFNLKVINETRNGLDVANTFWKPKAGQANDLHAQQITPNTRNFNPSDYYVVFSESNDFGSTVNTSNVTVGGTVFSPYPSSTNPKTNFKVFRKSTGQEVPFLFWERSATTTRGYFTADSLRSLGQLSYNSDFIVLMEDYGGRTNVDTWRIRMIGQILGTGRSAVGISRNPEAGDTLFISSYKPFTREDVYEFTMSADNKDRVDADKAKLDMKKIKVVPNPYVSANYFEKPITNSSNQQQRELHFTNLPVPCSLRIFTVSGVLVKEIKITEADQRLQNGTYVWNMLTKDNLEISYGVYLYHVDAPGVGTKVDKFAVIK